jgi:hypothetical protein
VFRVVVIRRCLRYCPAVLPPTAAKPNIPRVSATMAAESESDSKSLKRSRSPSAPACELTDKKLKVVEGQPIGILRAVSTTAHHHVQGDQLQEVAEYDIVPLEDAMNNTAGATRKANIHPPVPTEIIDLILSFVSIPSLIHFSIPPVTL